MTESYGAAVPDTTYHAVSSVPLEADDFPVLVRIPCDVRGCQRESWTSMPIGGAHGRVTLCSVHRSRLQMVLYRFLGMPDYAGEWKHYEESLARAMWGDGLTHETSTVTATRMSPWSVSDPSEWLCARCGTGMSGTGKIPYWMHRCVNAGPETTGADDEV
jgi:hypothetical protein